MSGISVPEGGTWQINRAIEFTFSGPIDFDSVNLNTISIREEGTGSVVGDFQFDSNDSRVVVFQPACPTRGDLTDAGLKPGGVNYQIDVPDATSGSATVLSETGSALSKGLTLNFRTPDSTVASDLLLDTVPGPPSPLMRPDSSIATYVELGLDPDRREYFERGEDGNGELPEGFLLPINFYSDLASQVAIVLELNQPVSPVEENISSDRLRLEYLELDGSWMSVSTELELTANCTATGATVRMTPIGILPQDRALRVVISPEFEDLGGDRNVFPLDSFALMTTGAARDEAGAPVQTADEFHEGFSSVQFADLGAALDAPIARWGPDGLQAAFSFGGTGGPEGEFDLHLAPGSEVIFDTTSTMFFGGPGGVPQHSQLAINGRLDVRDLVIPAGATLRIQGPNPALILASGEIRIDGTLSVDGASATSVFSIRAPFQPEPGAAGRGGGGAGGTGSYLTSQATPRGGNGEGAFGAPNLGGEGGESGYSYNGNNYGIQRRAAGGGGGAFGHDQLVPLGSGVTCKDQMIYGLDAESGFVGNPQATSAQDPSHRPFGGHPGPRPFSSLGGTDDDFWGTKRKDFGTPDERLVIGELTGPLAGSGGGAGGDATHLEASETYPPPGLIPLNHDKGAGGGGGAGSLTILALGDVIISSTGRISAVGGHGNGGGNTGTVNRIGGGSGGGSGGHLIIQTASRIDFSQVPRRFMAFDVRGGEGGEGNNQPLAPAEGGAYTSEVVNVKRDAKHDAGVNDNPWDIAAGFPTECQNTYEANLPGPDPATGIPGGGGNQMYVVDAAGGDGGPGVIQLHVGDPATDILYPNTGGADGSENELANICRPVPVGYQLDAYDSPNVAYSGHWADHLLPIFGRYSKAQSTWVPLGEAAVAPESSVTDPLSFLFDGTDPSDGLVEAAGGVVLSLSPLLAPAAALEAPGLPEAVGSHRVRLDAAALASADDIYKRNPNLLRSFRLMVGAASHTVEAAEYITEEGDEYLELDLSHSDPSLDGATGLVQLVPRYFTVTTNGVEDALPENSSIKIEFQATTKNSLGAPDGSSQTPWVTDATVLDQDAGASPRYRFVRFRVSFDITGGVEELDGSTPRPRLDFLRLPFRF